MYVKLPSICASVYGSLKVAIGDSCRAHMCISMDEGMHDILLPMATGYGKEITGPWELQ